VRLRPWYLRAGMLLRRGRRRRRSIALDETVVKVVGVKSFVWSAVDACSEEPLATYLSTQRSFVHAHNPLPRKGFGEVWEQAVGRNG